MNVYFNFSRNYYELAFIKLTKSFDGDVVFGGTQFTLLTKIYN